MSDTVPFVPTVSHFNRQIDAFYQQLYKELTIFISAETPTKSDGSAYRNFLEYWTYTLFRDYGIKRKIHKYGETSESEYETDLERKIFGDNKKLLIQFYYNKGSKSYDKTKLITQLCRHMLFDFASFSIVSLGVTKSVELETMFNSIPAITDEGHRNLVIEEFREGTMLVYNPSLNQFNYKIIQRDVDEETENSERQIRHFETSTRRKIGTSYFNNPGMTFQQMFYDNNSSNNLNWDIIPNVIKEKYCFVFNVEHNENRIVSPFTINRNTLVAVYQLKKRKDNLSILTDLIRNDEISDDNEFMKLRQDVITEIPPFMISQLFQSTYGQTVNIPKVISPFQGTYKDLQRYTSNIISQQGKYDIGIVVKDMYSGLRSKVRNPSYSFLLELKGHLPMSLNEANNANLFRLWWRLKNTRKIKKFLSVFETKSGEYEKLFRSYYDKLIAMTQNLFDVYQSVFLRHEMHARDIEYKFKPMCGDLHKAYMAEQRGRTKKDVVEYINSREWFQIYWRLFGLSTPDNSDDEVESLSNSTDEIKLPDAE